MNHKFLFDTARANGNTLRLIDQNEGAMLWEGQTPNGAVFFEVWRAIRTKRAFTFPATGIVVPAGSLRRPGNEDFGRWAWCFYSRERALIKFNSLGNASTRAAA